MPCISCCRLYILHKVREVVLWGNSDNTSCQAPEVFYRTLLYDSVYTSTYWYIQVCTGMYCYIPVFHSMLVQQQLRWGEPLQVLLIFVQMAESAAACAGHCNQCILPFPFLPWIYLLPLPYPQHQACFQKIPRLLHKDGDPRPRNLYGQEQELAWHHRSGNLETLCQTMRLKNCKMCTYRYVRVHTEMYAYILLYSLYDMYVPVHTITYSTRTLSYSHHIIRVLPHGLGEWSTSIWEFAPERYPYLSLLIL